MNENELDEVLKRWKTPEPAASLRERVRAGYRAATPARAGFRAWIPSGGKLAFAGAMIACAAILLAAAQTMPSSFQSLLGNERIPYAVETEEILYDASGTPGRAVVRTAFTDKKGMGEVLSTSYEDRPLESVFQTSLDSVGVLMHEVLMPLFHGEFVREARERYGAVISSGCVREGREVIGHTKVLGHDTTINQAVYSDTTRHTTWEAPDLNCFALRSETEELRGGTYKLARSKRSLKITIY